MQIHYQGISVQSLTCYNVFDTDNYPDHLTWANSLNLQDFNSAFVLFYYKGSLVSTAASALIQVDRKVLYLHKTDILVQKPGDPLIFNTFKSKDTPKRDEGIVAVSIFWLLCPFWEYFYSYMTY